MNYDSVPLRDFKELNDWETVMFVYQSALKQINTKIDILNDEFQHRHKYNPIEHVKSRIKTPESWKVSNLRVYIAASNLFTITAYNGLDPEMTVSTNSAAEGDRANGIDWGTYPVAKSVTAGINLTF